MATNMNFQDFVTPVPADWLNNVNTVVNSISGSGTLNVANLNATTSATAPTVAVGTNSTAVATTAFVAHRPGYTSVMDYGADNTGTHDCTAAFFAAISAATVANTPAVYFPPGSYLFNGNLTYNFPSITSSIAIIGAGSELSYLIWPAGGGLTIQGALGAANSVIIRDLSFITGAVNTGNAIELNNTDTSAGGPQPQASSDITNVTIRGSSYQSTVGWNAGIVINYWGQIAITNVQIWGGTVNTNSYGIFLTSSAARPAVVFNIQGCSVNFTNIGLYYGAGIQGVCIQQTNMVGVNFGCFVPAGLPFGQDQFTITTSQFNFLQAGVYVLSPMPGLMISNNLFIVSSINGTAIITDNTGDTIIIGNSFNEGVGGVPNGILIGSAWLSQPTIITGNLFNAMFGAAIILQNTSSFVNVQSNVYTGNGTNILNSGTNNTIGGGSI